jgi:ribosomal protein RSM22 (predicted rRNA methylase)
MEYAEREAMAFLAVQFLNSYTPNIRIMREIQNRLPQFTPESILDFGTGPGTSLWAAAEVWPEIKKLIGIDTSEAMLQLAERLAENNFENRLELRRFLSFSTKVQFVNFRKKLMM